MIYKIFIYILKKKVCLSSKMPDVALNVFSSEDEGRLSLSAAGGRSVLRSGEVM